MKQEVSEPDNLVKVDELIVGGVNQDWPVEEHPDAVFKS